MKKIEKGKDLHQSTRYKRHEGVNQAMTEARTIMLSLQSDCLSRQSCLTESREVSRVKTRWHFSGSKTSPTLSYIVLCLSRYQRSVKLNAKVQNFLGGDACVSQVSLFYTMRHHVFCYIIMLEDPTNKDTHIQDVVS